MEAFPAKNVLTGCEVDQLWRSLCIRDRERREKRGERERREGGKTARKRGELEINVVLQV